MRVEAERVESERVEQARLEAERVESERVEQVRLEAELAEAERIERERLEAERLAADNAERERVEAERLAEEQAERERLADQLAAERLSAEASALEKARESVDSASGRREVRNATESLVEELRVRYEAEPETYLADFLDALDQLATARWQAGDWWGSRAPTKEAKALRKQHQV